MKFITEDDLRDVYKKEPFTAYEIEPGSRLTPGARQFLADRGINMFDDAPCNRKNIIKEKPSPGQPPQQKSSWRRKKLHCTMKSIEAMFLLTGEELLAKDVVLAQNVMNLGRQFSHIRDTAMGKGSVENLSCQNCTGIRGDNFTEGLEDCFEITGFHAQAEKGKEIVFLHRLRCALREIEPILWELLEPENSQEETKLCAEITGKVNQIINILSQMICSAFGGKTCQRKD